jgi:hypothetical protein
MKFRRHFTLALLAAFATFAALLPASHLTDRVGKVAAEGPTLSLDADTSNGGPCAVIDPEVTVKPGQPFQVAVCMTGLTQSVAAFQMDFIYDDTVINAPEIALEDDALDDNPDANAGTTTWGESLGEGWTCDILGLGLQPIGDNIPDSGPGAGLAQIDCWTMSNSPTLGDDEQAGVLAVISFNGAPDKVGSTTIEPSDVTIGTYTGAEIGSCNPATTTPLTCGNATVHVLGETIPPGEWPTATPATGQIERSYSSSGELQVTTVPTAVGATPSAAGATPTAGPQTPNATVSPAKTAEAGAAKENNGTGDNGWVLPTVIGVVVALVVLGGGGAALASFLRRRGQPG